MLSDRPLFGLFVTVAVSAIVLSPALSRNPKDDFPLSTYPMFSKNKDRKATIDHAVYLDANEQAVFVAPRFVGTDEVLQSRATIARAIRRGAEPQRELCSRIAQKLGTDPSTNARAVELRTATWDAVAYFTESLTKPQSSTTHVRCEVHAVR